MTARQDELERFIDHRLKRLPVPEVPPTLLPRVMKSVRGRTAGHLRGHGWAEWPWAWRAGSLVGAMALIAVGALLSPALSVAPVPESSLVSALAGAGRAAAEVVGVAGPLWRAFLEPLWGYLFVISLMMSASCAALGAALNRVTLGGQVQ